jgi:hypothetical protein
MRSCFASIALGLAAFGAISPSRSAASVVVEFNPPAFNGDTPTGTETLPSPFLRATFTTTAINTVQVFIEVLGSATLPEFVDTIRFNSSVTPLSFSHVSGVVASSVTTGTFGASGGYGNIPGNFNVQFDYPSANAQRLKWSVAGSRTSTYDITGTGLTESSFQTLSTGGTQPMFAATHIGGFGPGSKSGAFEGTVVTTAVPEPSTLALAGLGGLGLIGHAWRRRNRGS